MFSDDYTFVCEPYVPHVLYVVSAVYIYNRVSFILTGPDPENPGAACPDPE